jgi:hypothetical protein
MPTENPLRSTRLPVRLLNAFFPAVRLASQLFSLLCFHALVPFRRAFRRRDPAPLATGSVAAVCATWAGGVPKPQRPAVFVSRLGVLFDTQRSAWIASWGGHGGVDKAGTRPIHARHAGGRRQEAGGRRQGGRTATLGVTPPAFAPGSHALPLPCRTVCLFDAEFVAQLAAAGHPMQPGAVSAPYSLSRPACAC